MNQALIHLSNHPSLNVFILDSRITIFIERYNSDKNNLIVFCSIIEYIFFSHSHPRGRRGRRALECNLTRRRRLFKNLHNLFRKKNCISIPCFGIIRLQKFPKVIGKQWSVVLENNSLLFLNK